MSSNHPRYGFDRYSNPRITYARSFPADGQHVSFISDITGVPQAWILDLATSRIVQLPLFSERVSSAVFSPTGESLGLSMDPGGSEKHQVWTLDMANLAAKKLTVGDDWIRVFGSFSPSGESVCYASNERDEKFFDIYQCGSATEEKNLVYHKHATNNALN